MTETYEGLLQDAETFSEELSSAPQAEELFDLIDRAIMLGAQRAEDIKADEGRRARERAVERRNRENGWDTGKPGWEPPVEAVKEIEA